MAETAITTTEQVEAKRPSLSDLKHNKKKALLVAIAETGGSLVDACRVAQTSRNNHYYWMQSDPIYAELYAEYYERSTQTLIAEAIARATVGTAEPIVYQGKQVTDSEGRPLFKYYKSDSLLMFLLKQRDPTFRDNFIHNVGIWSKSGQVNLHFNIPRPDGESIGKGVQPAGKICSSDNTYYVNQGEEVIDADAVEVSGSLGDAGSVPGKGKGKTTKKPAAKKQTASQQTAGKD